MDVRLWKALVAGLPRGWRLSRTEVSDNGLTPRETRTSFCPWVRIWTGQEVSGVQDGLGEDASLTVAV